MLSALLAYPTSFWVNVPLEDLLLVLVRVFNVDGSLLVLFLSLSFTLKNESHSQKSKREGGYDTLALLAIIPCFYSQSYDLLSVIMDVYLASPLC